MPAQVLERLGIADLLNGEHVGADVADHSSQLGELGLVGLVVAGTLVAVAPRVTILIRGKSGP